MKIFITGINGVLGSELKDRLRSRGHDVYGCDLTHSADPQIVRADIREYRQLKTAMNGKQYDLVYHLAGEFGRVNGQKFYEELWSTNCIGTQNVIEECVSRRTKMVFASSSEAYGLSEVYNQGLSLSEDMLDKFVPSFHNQYALSKYTNERQIFTAARNSDLDAIVLRFFNVYGPPERYSPYRSVVCQFIYKLLAGLPVTVNRGGKRSHLWIKDWSFTVGNIADPEFLNHAAMQKHWPGSAGTPYVPVFNIGGTEYESIEELYDRIVYILGSSIPNPEVTYIEEEVANCATKKPDNSMAELWLNHKPVVSLDAGLRETVQWVKDQYGF